MIRTIDATEFDAFVADRRNLIVLLAADGCAPCEIGKHLFQAASENVSFDGFEWLTVKVPEGEPGFIWLRENFDVAAIP